MYLTKIFNAKAILLILFLNGMILNIDAQNSGMITGYIKDAEGSSNILSATVLLYDKKTDTIVKTVQTDKKGSFTLADLPDGLFICKANYIGYKTVVRDSIVISPIHRRIVLSDIKMDLAEGTTLKEVTIISSKNASQIGISKKKFSVEESLVSKGGTATDLLQNIPTVTVDGSGSISLRGTTNVNVLIDGKPSLIGGGNIAQILKSIPAGSIESVEVITNPSAKYDAEGESGIINIILKKNKKLGFNGSANASAGLRNNYSGGTNLSFENSKVNIYANYDYQHNNIHSNGHQNIQYLKPDNETVFSNENFPSTTIVNVHNFKGGIDYYLTPKNLLSISGGFNTSMTHRDEYLTISQLDAARSPLQLINNTNLTNGRGSTYNLNLDFIRTFNQPKEELTLSIGYAHGRSSAVQSFTSYINNLNPFSQETNILHPISNNHNDYYNIQADYILPVGTGKIEAGYRSQIRLDSRSQQVSIFNNDTQNYDEYYPFDAYFYGRNQIHALYFNYQNQMKNFSYQIGLRGEYANLKGKAEGYDINNAMQTTPVDVVNKRLFPTVTLTQKLNGNQELQLSYARRITRPSPRNYSPIPDVSDPVNYDAGNPNILPEDIHSIELGYSKKWNKINLTSSLYYRITNDFIAHVESTPSNGIITTTSINIPHSYAGGLEIISRFNIIKAWNFSANANLYENKTDPAPEFGIDKSNGFSWNTNITNNFSITKNISLQVRTDYQAPSRTAQDRTYTNFGVDAGVKVNLFHNKAVLAINGRDIFATRKWSFLRNGNSVLLDFERKTIGARASISFTYNFGKDIFKAKKIEHSTEKQDN